MKNLFLLFVITTVSFSHTYAGVLDGLATCFGLFKGVPPIVSDEEARKMGVPEKVLELNRTRPKVKGPNCYNAVCMWHGITENLEHIDRDDFAMLLDVHFEQLPLGTEPRFGDLIVLWNAYDPDWGPIHAMIYVDRGRMWHKKGMFRQGRWEFFNESLDELTASNGVLYRVFRRRNDTSGK